MLRVVELLLKRKMQLAIWLMHNTKYKYLEWMCTSFILLNESAFFMNFYFLLSQYSQISILCTHFNFLWHDVLEKQHSREDYISNEGVFLIAVCLLTFNVLQKHWANLKQNHYKHPLVNRVCIEWRASPFWRGDNS